MPTERTTVRRRASRGQYDREAIDAVLDEAIVCHVAVSDEEGPIVLPTGFVRIGDEVIVHGAASNHLLRMAADGRPVCIVVTLLDGLVLARSAFRHSMNYRSVVLFGRARVVDGQEKEEALAAFVEHVTPGRSAQVRAPSPSELDATLVVALPLHEASAKVRVGPPNDPAEDMALDVWAGVVPLHVVQGEPIPDSSAEPGP